MLPREAELVSEWTGLPGEESVKRLERSNGLDSALYKNTPFLLHTFSMAFYLFGTVHQVFFLQVIRSCASSLFTPVSFLYNISPPQFWSSVVHSLPCSHYYNFFSFSPYMSQPSQSRFSNFLTYICHTLLSFLLSWSSQSYLSQPSFHTQWFIFRSKILLCHIIYNWS